MGKHRKRLAADAPLVGLAWYTRTGWQRLRELAADREALDDSFEDWERGARAALEELSAAGHRIGRVPIDVEALAVWCQQHGRRLDHAARAEYVTHLLQRGAGRLSLRS